MHPSEGRVHHLVYGCQCLSGADTEMLGWKEETEMLVLDHMDSWAEHYYIPLSLCMK